MKKLCCLLCLALALPVWGAPARDRTPDPQSGRHTQTFLRNQARAERDRLNRNRHNPVATREEERLWRECGREPLRLSDRPESACRRLAESQARRGYVPPPRRWNGTAWEDVPR